MVAMKQILEIETQLVRSTYIVLNIDLYIQEIYQDNIGLFSYGSGNLVGKKLNHVIGEKFLELAFKIEAVRSRKIPSLYKVITEQNDEYEVEILPFERYLLLLVKDRLTETNLMINKIYDKNKELEIKYNEVFEKLELSYISNREKTDLLLLLCHEFRTPLNIINGYLQLLLPNSEKTLSKEQQNHLSKINKASKQLEMIVSDALDFVKLKKNKLSIDIEYIDINNLIGDCIQAQSLEASEKNIEITHKDEETNVLIYSDKKRLTQVLMNILSNAVKYTNEGGYIQINSIRNEQRLLIEIIDTGVGIQAKELAYIFSPYYRSSSTDSMSSGFGIGLSLVKQVLTELGGLVHVSSEVGIGSRFIIELPTEH